MAACPEALYGNAAAEHAATPQLEAVLQALPQMTPDQQWLSVGSLHPQSRNLLPKEPTPAEARRMIEFAADDESGVAELVRLQCLSHMLETVSRADDPAYADLQADIDAVLPVNYLSRVSGAAQYWNLQDSLIGPSRNYYDIAVNVARDDGVSHSLVLPDWRELGYNDYLEMPDEIPVAASLLLSRLDGNNAAGTSLEGLLPLAQRLRERFPAETAALANDEVTKRLAYFTLPQQYAALGGMHIPELQALASEVGTPHDRAKYMRQFELLERAAVHLPNAFPEEFQAGTLLGVRELVADSVFAVRSHLESGNRTRALLPLNGKPEVLPVVMAGEMPLYLLRAITEACFRAGSLGHGYSSNVVNAVRGDGYSVYRHLRQDDEMVTYVRPFAGRAYDRDLEFGRHYEGVGASIGVTLDMARQPGRLMELGRHRGSQPDTRLSIRLDRDTFSRVDSDGQIIQRDPTDPEGMLSFDFGSVLGHHSWIGTQIGRFLAYGNYRRTQEDGQPAGLNHVRRHFTTQDGDAAYFGAVAQRYDDNLARRSLSEEEVMRRFTATSSVAQLAVAGAVGRP